MREETGAQASVDAGMSRHHARMNARLYANFRRAVFERDGWRCVRCGNAGRLEAHHKKPVSMGGAPFLLANAETLCRDCHIGHHKPTPPPEVRDFKKLALKLLSAPF